MQALLLLAEHGDVGLDLFNIEQLIFSSFGIFIRDLERTKKALFTLVLLEGEVRKGFGQRAPADAVQDFKVVLPGMFELGIDQVVVERCLSELGVEVDTFEEHLHCGVLRVHVVALDVLDLVLTEELERLLAHLVVEEDVEQCQLVNDGLLDYRD